MSFVPNDVQQINLFDELAFLSKRKQRILENSWAETFSRNIFSKIDEHVFAPLYSQNSNSRPNAPINVLIGALILKEFNGLTDEELEASCVFDFRYQYALHTTSYDDQPISLRSLSRLRSRLAAYELTTGEDLLHTCFISMSDEIREFMGIAPTIKRMDSLMIESSIRKMGRLELLHTCLANLVKALGRSGRTDLIGGLEHYADPNDRNRTVYHNSDIPQLDRLQKIIDDALALLPKCSGEYGNTTDYQLLERAIQEQTKQDDHGNIVPKGKGDGMDSSILQNPADPDATYRAKAGKEHRGYAANVTETVGENGSIVSDYQYDINTRSDEDFLHEYIENAEATEETTAIIADGAYSSQQMAELAAEKNIGILTTGFIGKSTRNILADFELTKDGLHVASCPQGHVPLSTSYTEQNNSVRASFPRSCCEGCPHQKECLAKLHARTAVVNIPLHSRELAVERNDPEKSMERTLIARIRNGVETIPSILRRKYNVDHMPVRGKLRTKVFFGFKMFALNFNKLWLYTRGLEKCRAFE